MDDRTMQQQVAFLVRCLLEERKRTGGWLPPREPGADASASSGTSSARS